MKKKQHPAPKPQPLTPAAYDREQLQQTIRFYKSAIIWLGTILLILFAAMLFTVLIDQTPA